MTEDILDYPENAPKKKKIILEETDRYRKILSCAWIFYSLLLVNQSFSIFKLNNHRDENEGFYALIDCYIPSIEIAYHYLSLSFLSLVIARVILKNKPSRKELLIIVCGIITLYHLFEFFFLFSYEFFLRKEGLFFGLLVFASFKRQQNQLFPLHLAKIRLKFIPLLTISLLPFLVQKIIDYNEIRFWDIDFRWLEIWFS